MIGSTMTTKTQLRQTYLPSVLLMGELAFRNDGSIEVYYDDDDIFWGHCIIANIDVEGNPVDADIAG